MAHPGRGKGRGHDRSSGGPPQMPRPREVAYFAGADRKALSKAAIEDAEQLAPRLAGVAASQLRRFFGDVTAFERRLDLDGSLPDEAVQAQMALLKARAAYAYRRGNRSEFPDDLLQFFVDHAAAVKNRLDFKAFRKVFETLIAFHKFHERKTRGEG